LDAFSDVSRQGVGSRRFQSCVIVCGLHRSGTSAVTRLINLLGAEIADDLLPHNLDNSRGYWESHAIVRINKRLLRVAAAVRNDRFDPLPLRAGWLETAGARDAKQCLADIVQKQFGGSRLFVVKDPRIARLLPLWLELLRDLGIGVSVVVPFRNPLEVAQSLAQRDQISLPKALLLYLQAYLETELASRNVPRLFVRYDALLRDWRPFVRRLNQISGLELLPVPHNVAAEIDEFLTMDLYHHRFSREHMAQSSEVQPTLIEMFDRMDEAAETGDEERLRGAFDRLRAGVDVAARLYGEFLISERRDLQDRLVTMQHEFETSTSWRITAPLRWCKRALPRPATRPERP
jgi:hypothetical protein